MTRKNEIEEYETYLKAKGNTAYYVRTSRNYLRALGDAFGPDSFADLTKKQLIAWFADLREKGFTGRKGLAEASLKTVASYTKAFLRWLNDGETPPSLRGLSIGKARTRIRSKGELLTPDELERLLRPLGPQKKAILRLLAVTGARPSEVLGLRREDVALRRHDGNGTEYAELAFRDTKTDVPRTVPTNDAKAISALKDYLEIAPPAGYLFPSPSREGQPLTERSLWAVMNRAAKAVGLTKRVYPYILRHGRATELHDAPSGVRDRLMGWKSGVMWKNYEHLATDDLRDYLFEREGPRPEITGVPVSPEWATDVSSTIRQLAAVIQGLDDGRLSKKQRQTVDAIRESFE